MNISPLIFIVIACGFFSLGISVTRIFTPVQNLDEGITSVYTECEKFILIQHRDGRTIIEFNREDL